MKIPAAIFLVLAIGFGQGTHLGSHLVRVPSLDRAVVHTNRIGGNFAYSTVEGHAYAGISPVVQHLYQPVGIPFAAHQYPLGIASAPLVQQPFFSYPSLPTQYPIFANPPATVIPQHPAFIGGISPVGPAGPVGIAPAPTQDQIPAADAPFSPGSAVVDEDTVAIESA